MLTPCHQTTPIGTTGTWAQSMGVAPYPEEPVVSHTHWFGTRPRPHPDHAVELAGTHTGGRRVVDLHGVAGRQPNAWGRDGPDVDRFRDLIVTAIAALG